MRIRRIIRFSIFLILATACTVEFFPDIDLTKDQLVVEGMITDQNRVNTIKLSRSLTPGKPLVRKPVKGAVIKITDETGAVTTLKEILPGNYSTDSTKFRGRVGGQYSLDIRIINATYSTGFIEMIPVPEISSVYYEKVIINQAEDSLYRDEGCKIFLDTYDPSGKCLFFRWDFTETYEYQVPYDVVNKICWVTEKSDRIMIRNTSVFNQARVSKYPIQFITDKTDKLKERYSILIKQYSLTEPEYEFWENVQNVSQNVGGLYDITPISVQGNIECTSNPEETVLGYFCVSAVTQKRLFIKDTFLGLPNFYVYCATDTITGQLPEANLNNGIWVIEDYSNEIPPFWVVTTYRECGDCTTKGTKVRPSFWSEYLLDNK